MILAATPQAFPARLNCRTLERELGTTVSDVGALRWEVEHLLRKLFTGWAIRGEHAPRGLGLGRIAMWVAPDCC
jgi:hypothetical protein